MDLAVNDPARALPAPPVRRASRAAIGLRRLALPAQGLVLVSALLATPAPSTAMGPRAPFTPPQPATGPGVAVPVQAAAAVAEAPLLLQGLRTGVRPLALIDGRWWPLGQGPRGLQLTAVDASGVWLRDGPRRLQRLSLLRAEAAEPAMDETPAAPQPRPPAGTARVNALASNQP